ncbi:MAG TPA: DNA repair exonuclease, partial [Candidatus Xenobia bacterium]
RYQDAPVQALRNASRRALENLVELALAEDVAFVLVAGDLYDGNWPDFNTGLFFVHQMARLDRRGIQVYLVRGNHDADSRLTRALPLPPNVRVLSSRRPETITNDALQVAVHGQSFPEAAVTADLSAGYPPPVPGWLNIGLLHTCLTGRDGHADYAPCSLEGLLSKGYDYWALGHVHAREVVHEAPWVVFPGNLQGRHARETGSKGCELVTVDGGRVVSVQHRPVDVIRWHRLELDLSGCATLPAVHERIQHALQEAIRASDGRPAAARLILRGRCEAHGDLLGRPEGVREDIRAMALACHDGELWVEKIRLETAPRVDLAPWAERDDPMGELMRLIDGIERQPGVAADLLESWQELLRKLPPELSESSDDFRLADPLRYRPLLGEVKGTLLSRLLDL